MSAGGSSEARFLRYKHLRQMFPVLPGQSGYNKRLRKLAHTMAWLIGVLATQVSMPGVLSRLTIRRYGDHVAQQSGLVLVVDYAEPAPGGDAGASPSLVL